MGKDYSRMPVNLPGGSTLQWSTKQISVAGVICLLLL